MPSQHNRYCAVQYGLIDRQLIFNANIISVFYGDQCGAGGFFLKPVVCRRLGSMYLVPTCVPEWYHSLQLLSIVAWLGLAAALLMLMLPTCLEQCLPQAMVLHRQAIVSGICIVSGVGGWLLHVNSSCYLDLSCESMS